MTVKGIAWAMAPSADSEAALLWVVVENKVLTRTPDSGWHGTIYMDEATADRAVMYSIETAEMGGAVVAAGPVGFELQTTNMPEVGFAAEKALGPVGLFKKPVLAASIPMRYTDGRWVHPPRAKL